MIKMTPVEYLLVDSNDSISYTNVMYVHFLFKKKRSMQPKKMHYITWTTITTHIEIFSYPQMSTQQLIQQKRNF